MAGLVEKLPEGGSFLGNATLQSPLAHAQLFGDHEEVGPTAGQQSPQNPLYLPKDALSRATLLQLIFEMRCKHLQEFIVVRDEGNLQVGSAQNKRIASGAIFHSAAKVFLEAILRSAGRVSSMRLGFSLVLVPRRPSSVTSAKTASINKTGAGSSRQRARETSTKSRRLCGDPKFLGAAKLFVARESLDGFAIGSGV